MAAGADAIYCGMKRFSARMAARNFDPAELAALTRLAHAKGVRVYLTLNSLIKDQELGELTRSLKTLDQSVRPDAVIFQDLAVIEAARRVGFRGELHLSTLANASFPGTLKLLASWPEVTRVVVPRELNIDEIKAMAAACPAGTGLEVFVHGALCYGVSGRCYWSSFLGGKSGLQGRCVQPCRRRYRQGDRRQRMFSCMDLSLDVLVKVLADIDQVKTWKIEGRKKGPHYVYYTVAAYKMLRDEGRDPRQKKAALALLGRALGRKGTHYTFLPQRPFNPIDTDSRTGSGLFVGALKGAADQVYLVPNETLLPGDVLRLGYEDDAGHGVHRVRRQVPKGGRLHFKRTAGFSPRKGTAVLLIDRREPGLQTMIDALDRSVGSGAPEKKIDVVGPVMRITPYRGRSRNIKPVEMGVSRSIGGSVGRFDQAGFWLDSDGPPRGKVRKQHWVWLPPVLWPAEEVALRGALDAVIKHGCRHFVVNMPWQRALFPPQSNCKIWAGPFCNIANAAAAQTLAQQGFSGVIASPELDREEFFHFARQSPLPTGIVLSGLWPFCVSRTLGTTVVSNTLFASPRGEQGWARQYGSNYWVFPNWELDIRRYRAELARAGYSLFVHLQEPLPRKITLKKREGLWNWRGGKVKLET